MGVPQQAQHPGGQLTDEELGVGGPLTMTGRGERSRQRRTAVLAAVLALALGGCAPVDDDLVAQGSSEGAPLVLATVPLGEAGSSTPAPILSSRAWAATRWQPTATPPVAKASAAVPKPHRDLSAAAPRPGHPHSRVPA